MTPAPRLTPGEASWGRLRQAYGWGSVVWTCVLLLIALGSLSIGLGLEMRRAHDPLGGRFFPVVISSLLAVAAVAILLSPVARMLVGLPPTAGRPEGAPAHGADAEAGLLDRPAVRVVAMVVVCIAYVALLGLTGYIAATVTALAACMYLLGTRGLRGLVVMPVLTAAILYVVFTYALFVRLP